MAATEGVAALALEAEVDDRLTPVKRAAVPNHETGFHVLGARALNHGPGLPLEGCLVKRLRAVCLFGEVEHPMHPDFGHLDIAVSGHRASRHCEAMAVGPSAQGVSIQGKHQDGDCKSCSVTTQTPSR